MVGKMQQLTTTTITITPNITNRNVPDNVFIATAGLTPRAAIIKHKVLILKEHQPSRSARLS
jgi:hypothetical protein